MDNETEDSQLILILMDIDADMDIDIPWNSLDNTGKYMLSTAGTRRSVQNNVIWMNPKKSKSTAVATTSGQSMDVDITGNSPVTVGTCRVYVKPLPNQVRSYIKPAQGNFINKGQWQTVEPWPNLIHQPAF